MPYETGTATGPNDLLAKLSTFAQANGWTQEYSGGRTNAGGGLQAGSNNALSLRRGAQSWMLYQASDTISSNPGPRIIAYTYPGPFSAAAGTDLQTGRTSTVNGNGLAGPYVAYHAFTDATKTYLHCAIEVQSGLFSHLHIGNMDGAGAGEFSYAAALYWERGGNISFSNSGSHAIPWDDAGTTVAQPGAVIRADSDGISPRNYRLLNTIGTTEVAWGGFRNAGDRYFGSEFLNRVPPSNITGRAVLIPPLVAVSRGSTSQRSFIGSPHDLRLVNIQNISPGQTITIGSDQWICFPVIRKNGLAGQENSGNWGYAYRIVP